MSIGSVANRLADPTDWDQPERQTIVDSFILQASLHQEIDEWKHNKVYPRDKQE